ncbi:MAG: hypothetical protein H0W44_03195 [Gammaproteobacteria bacterium]|nr:hypothetical protein [Gammaproteobacteria bacterium]
MQRRLSFSILTATLATSLLLSGCNKDNSPPAPSPSPPATRSFYMGFTPWPYEATITAIDDTYIRIQQRGDIVKHHLDSGIPWQAAYDKTTYPSEVENGIAARLVRTQSNKIIYLAIDPLNGARDDLAGDWNSSGTNQPRSGAWATRNLDDPEVIEAYTNFALNMITRFQPKYFDYGTEVSVLMLTEPAKFTQFVTFAAAVYSNIKAVHPQLPLIASISLNAPGSTEMQQVTTDFARITNYVDIVGISAYPYILYDPAYTANPNSLPSNWLTQIKSIVGNNKRLAISETGWIAQPLTITNYSYSEYSDANYQAAYIERVLTEAQSLGAEFVIWFALTDYDALWNTTLGQSDIGAIWRDTGLYDENILPRTGLNNWSAWLAKTYAR